jgi:hypothetical protein
MRSVWLTWLIAGCGFSGPGLPEGDDPGGSGGSGGATGSGTVDTSACDVHDASLRLCLTFEHSVVQDLVTPPHHLAIAAGVTPILRILSDAAKLDGGSQIRFDESADLDVADRLTVDMWIDPDHAVQTGSYTMIDNHLQYTVSYEQDQRIQCNIGGQTVRSSVDIGIGWHHVACRYDGSKNEVRVYVDGNVAGCGSGPSTIPTSLNTGLAIGASYDGTSYQNHFIGSLDALHLYASALPDGAICSAATGRTSCFTKCPDGDGGHGPGR